MNRRLFLGQTAAAMTGGTLLPHLGAAEAAAAIKSSIRIGSCVCGLPQARAAGLDGVEVGVGNAADRLQIADENVRQRYKEQMRETGLPISSLIMVLLNACPLASDPRAPAWLEQSIDAARDLGARVILLAFFSQGDLLDSADKVKESDVDEAVRRIKAVAPRAKDAGVILGIENYLNGEQNARILDRINHESVQIYYDVFNTGTTKHHNVPADIRLLKGRIAQFHFKNGPKYLDDDAAKFEPIAAAIKETGYQGWIVLETSSPSKDVVADVRRNADYVRKLFA
ncbi:MAG: sugar phosphate isomerase/epimerase [Verrucomicrobia bacterium]|nr:sugar phosphate isomerase/epimerase [Verrucomicrobiota bacterium]